jgi:hypothetical protein
MEEPMREPLPENPVVPLEYAGLWIAWDRDHTRIVASGPTIDGAHEAAMAGGELQPILGKAPDADVWFAGGPRLDTFPIL